MNDRKPTHGRAVFFDRDGTLMEEVHYCADPEKVRTFPGTAEALGRLRENGWHTIVITNQSGIGRGIISMEAYRAVERELLRQLEEKIDATYFCPDTPENATPRRKPGTGMLEEAARDWGLALERCWMVGDKQVDVMCGRAAGCRTALVRTGYGSREAEECQPDFIAENVVEAVTEILRREGGAE